MRFVTLFTTSLLAAVFAVSGCESADLVDQQDPLEGYYQDDEAPKIPENNNESQEPADQNPPVTEQPEEPVEPQEPQEPQQPVDPVEPVDPGPPVIEAGSDLLEELPKHAEQLDTLCSRGNENAVTRAFCNGPRPTLTGLTDLQALLGLEFVDIRPGRNGRNGNPSFAITGHSSSLVTKSVSSLNPRSIIFNEQRNDRDDREFVAMGFTRGDQFAEIMTFTEETNDGPGVMTFYLLKYDKPCNATDAGCNNADLLLPQTETNWADYSLYEDVDLKNTVVDCLQCHQPNGPGTQKMLRMQELRNPWTHWMRDNREPGQLMIADFMSAHGEGESYAGIPGVMIEDSDPANLEDFVRNAGFDLQPNEFRTSDIQGELDNDGVSSTWEALYDNAVQGNVIPPPFFDQQIIDQQKYSEMVAAYQAAKDGTMAPGDMPDVRDVFREDIKPFMSLRPKPGLDGRGILTHMCAQCHNPRLDQELTRARFDIVNIDDMSREEKDIAIQRLLLPRDSRLAMPPPFFRDLSQEEIDLAVQFLSQ